MYDLLLTGGKVLDPSQGIHGKMDVAITGESISQLAPSIPATEAARVVDVTGKIVTPGLIDIHTHIFHPGRSRNHPDIAGVRAGVTTVSDGGGSGPTNYQEFCDFVLPQAQSNVYCFLSIFGDTNAGASRGESDLDVAGVVSVARQAPEMVKGVKIVLRPAMIEAMGLKALEAARDAAREAGIRIMIHIGDIGPKDQTPTPPEVTARALSMLSPGDIVTHVFSPLTGAAVDTEGRILAELVEARSRGVVMDSSYGDFNFGWERAEAVMSQGLIPDTVGTDSEIQSNMGIRQISTRTLLEDLAVYLQLGFSLEDVVRMTTINPARGLGIEERAGSLASGRSADISVLEIVEGRWNLTDATGESRVGSKALVPVFTIKNGEIIESDEPLHPWGWSPPVAAEAGAPVGD